ncbi:major facilitator superfamily domain-containing protein [Rhexocercosporidium sp. MPI-PUGE-AT-0058]|nr:major facilitator superfamily domain-containing protein [Rhexocercosporidium sp. MPI-PUGE-AT-0058]
MSAHQCPGHANALHGENGELVLQPQPSRDPNDPLNWSPVRKYINFAIVALYTLWIFTILDIGTVAWQVVTERYHLSYNDLTDGYASNLAGLAFGCVLFIPFALKFGRRPVYISSTFASFICAIWAGFATTPTNIILSQLLAGLAGAIAETLVYMTIADIFFTHQRGRATAVLSLFVLAGSFLAPICAGYILEAQGWQWSYWYTAIFLGITCAAFIFFYEETKYTPPSAILGRPPASSTVGTVTNAFRDMTDTKAGSLCQAQTVTSSIELSSRINHTIPLKSYRERLAFTTNTPGGWPKLFQHMYQPLLLLGQFPAVTFVAVEYGCLLSWLSMMVSTQSSYFPYEPYNFSPSAIGLLSLPPFIGSILGAVWCGPVSDWSIQVLAKRNKGVFQPEMRLYIMIVPAILSPRLPWIVPCLGMAINGFGLTGMGGLCSIFLLDSYKEIVADGFVVVAFMRNMLAMVVVFSLTPWIEGMGVQNTFILVGAMCLFINLLMIPMIIFGKKWRLTCGDRYEKMAALQFAPRST